jgi:hypothetical protein
MRSVEAGTSQLIGMEETLTPKEKHGFTVIDLTRDNLTSTPLYGAPPQVIADTMRPAFVYEVPRKARDRDDARNGSGGSQDELLDVSEDTGTPRGSPVILDQQTQRFHFTSQ